MMFYLSDLWVFWEIILPGNMRILLIPALHPPDREIKTTIIGTKNVVMEDPIFAMPLATPLHFMNLF